MSPELKLEGVRFRVYRGTELRTFGRADRVSLRRDSTELAASDVDAILPRSAPPVRISAPSGQGVLASRAFSASGGVTVARGDDVGRTERARYVPGPDGGRVLGDDPIVVHGRSYRLDGTGFTLLPADGSITIDGGARLLTGAGTGR